MNLQELKLFILQALGEAQGSVTVCVGDDNELVVATSKGVFKIVLSED